MSLQGFSPQEAPVPKGDYSHAIVHNGVVYTTATHPLDPTSGDVIEGDVEAQTVFRNLAAILDSAGSGLDLIIKNGVYITDPADAAVFNQVSAELLAGNKFPPARATVLTAGLPRGAKIVIDAIAVVRQ